MALNVWSIPDREEGRQSCQWSLVGCRGRRKGMILAVIVLSEWTSAEWSVGQFNMEKYQSCACFQSSAHFFSPHNDIVEAFIFSLFKPSLLIVSYCYRDCNF